MTVAPEESLCGFLRASCARAEEGLIPAHAKEVLAAVRERLSDDVLRIAVAGRLNAGKSTLVNALLGQKLAPTDATECTRIPTWFRYGVSENVTVRFADGSEIKRAGDKAADALAALDLSAEELARVTEIEVRSPNVILNKYAIVDTPGLDTTSDFDDLSVAALRKADVLIFVTPHPGAEDRNAFARLRDEDAGLPGVGVLSRVDELGTGRGDPWPAARREAVNAQRQLGLDVSMVIPVVGLLAETALADAFGEQDVPPLRRLYEFEVSDPIAVAKYTASDFHDGHAEPLSAEEGSRLVSLLGSYGIRAALEEFRGGVRGAPDLLASLDARSGVSVLLDQIHLQFLSVADPLRAKAAIRKLDAVAWPGALTPDSAALAQLRDDLATAAADPRLLLLDIVANLTAWETGNWAEVPDPTAELARLVTGTAIADRLRLPADASPERVQEKLAARIGYWRLVEGSGNLDTARRARSVRQYLEAGCGEMLRPPPRS
jgi:Dynamin family